MTALANAKRFDITLSDRYTATDGWHYMTGMQALVRLPIQQRIRDELAGLNTAGFISGYRGSPLGRYDMELWQAGEALTSRDIVFQPGVNEDLAATAAWGSQYVGLFPGARVDGVFAIWYGKAPGVDRSMDPIRHSNLAGTSAKGGTLLLAGDDHGAKSSTLACYSDYNFMSAAVPFFAPANAQEVLDYGLHGIALSRFAGCLSGMKLVTDVVEGGGSVSLAPDSPEIIIPETEKRANILALAMFLDQERALHETRLDLALQYVRANALNVITQAAPGAKVGIVSTGKSWQDLQQALRTLAPQGAERIRLLKIGVVWPLDEAIIREFAAGLDTIIVVEEKRPMIEDQIRAILYGAPGAPKVVGKYFNGRAYEAEAAEQAFPGVGEFNPAMVARIVARAALAADPDCGLTIPNEPAPVKRSGGAMRNPSFCSGCPHGRSTQVPDGSRALAGIGCHTMAMMLDPFTTNSLSHMGGEGVMWIGQKPFTDEEHVFANMGDGTYFHSGMIAIRAAVAAKVPITYKLLHNGFVSMTGGQPIDGEITPERMVTQLLAEGVTRIALVSDEPEQFQHITFPGNVSLHHRVEMEAVQKEFREIPDVTVIVYSQPCATERRRLRKRGQWEDPDKRVFINSAVCEGCGDCSTVSNCMSIEPLETEFGRKRTINQSSCNKDFSCVEGFCPSFVTVSGASIRKPASKKTVQSDIPDLPDPVFAEIDGSYAVLISGIGGAGVVTVGQTLSMAAHVDGYYSSNLDVTGLAQKYGAVHSHVKFAHSPDKLFATRIAAGEADTIVGCDLVVTAGEESISKLKPGTGQLVADDTLVPTADFSRNPDWSLDKTGMVETLREASEDRAVIFDARKLAMATHGDAIYANMMLMGAAWQRGAIPVSHEALMRAIELNGVKIDLNKRAFAIGRLAAHDPQAAEAMIRQATAADPIKLSERREKSLEEVIAIRREWLTDYQKVALADHYEALVRRVETAENAIGGDGKLAKAVARYYFKLLAPKDEWEVARLYARPQFLEELKSTFDGDLRLTFHVGAWPFGRFDKKAGKAVKGEAGGWLLNVFKLMAPFRKVRGTLLDPFRWNAEAKLARRLLAEYEADVEYALTHLSLEKRDPLYALLALPDKIRGYGHVRERHAEQAEAERTQLKAAITAPPATQAAE